MIQPIKAPGPSPRLCDEPPEPSHSSHKNALNETRRPQPAGTKSHAAVTATPNASRARRPRATTSTIHPPLPLAPTKLRPRYLPETKFSRDGPSQVGSVHTPRFPFRRVYARQRGGDPSLTYVNLEPLPQAVREKKILGRFYCVAVALPLTVPAFGQLFFFLCSSICPLNAKR